MLCATTVPALSNWPAAYSVEPLKASAFTLGVPPVVGSVMPAPIAAHAVPFHTATALAATPPAFVNVPPTYTFDPATATALTSPLVPVPSARQVWPFHQATLL